MNIDAVEQWATDALLRAGDGGGRAGTFSNRITVVATGVPVQIIVADNLLLLCYAYATFLELAMGKMFRRKPWSKGDFRK